MFKEFKTFIARGNVIDLAVGVVIGAAFSKIVSSLVDDVIMPPVGMVLGKVDFNQLKVVLQPGDDKTEVALRYGVFLTNILQFLIVAFAIFMVVKAVNRTSKPEPTAAPTTQPCPLCLTDIPIGAKKCAHCTADLG